MSMIAKLSTVAVFGLACAACSQGQNPSQAPASAASVQRSASAQPLGKVIPMTPPGSAGSSGLTKIAPPSSGPALSQFMQRSGFEKTFEPMDGASQLPAWVQNGGTATPSQRVQVDGKTMWLAHDCESSECDTGELWLLVDGASHTMQGVFVEQAGHKGATTGKLVWLGKPDAAARAFLKERIAEN